MNFFDINIYVLHFFSVSALYVICLIFKKFSFKFALFGYSLVVFGQRWGVGVDFTGYLYYFFSKRKTEVIYYFFQNLFMDNKLSFSLFIFFITFVQIYIFLKFIRNVLKNNKKIINIVLYLYSINIIYFIQFSQLRQFLAINFLLLSYYYFYFDKTRMKIIIFFIIAFFCHYSIIIGILFYITKKKFFLKLRDYLIGIIFFIPFINFEEILFFLGKNLPIINNYINSYFNGYFDQQSSRLHYIFFLVFYILFCWMYFFRIKKKNINLLDNFLINGTVFYLLFCSLSTRNTLFIRIGYFFKSFELIFPMYFFYKFKFLKNIFIIGYIFIFIVLANKDTFGIKNYEFHKITIREKLTINEAKKEIERIIERRNKK